MSSCGFVEEINFVQNTQIPSDPTWWNTSWSNRRLITFDNSAQTEDLVDFPVLVKLDSTRIDYNKTQDGGRDIRFVDQDKTLLSHEIELWDESGESWVWVMVPQIDSGSSEDSIWMYYGNPAASDGQDITDVWDTDYLGVWHLSESAGPIADSTSTDNSGTNNGATFTLSGAVANAYSFNGNGDAIETSSYTYSFAEQMTIEAWFKYSGPGTGSPRILEISKTGNADSHCLAPDSDGSLRAWAETASGSRVASVDDPNSYNDGEWHYMVYTYSNPDGILYVDGDETDSASGASSDLDDGQYFIIGAVSDGSTQFNHTDHEFDGSIDEVRISNNARSADWIKAQYLSMDDSFISFGEEE
jgi:hypothetical protein